MPPQNKTIQDFYNQLELDKLYAGKSSGEGSNLVRAMQSASRLQSMPQGGGVQSLTPIGPLDFLAETAMTGASQMEDMNPLAMLLAGALAPGAYKKLKTTNTPALLKKYNIKVDTPLYHNTDEWGVAGILKTGGIGKTPKVKKKKYGLESVAGYREPEYVSLTRNPEMREVPGTGSRNIQVILDKKDIPGTKPYVYRAGATDLELGSPVFGKPSPSFEAEERLLGKSIPSSKIKAIKVRHIDSQGAKEWGKEIGLKMQDLKKRHMFENEVKVYNSLFKRAADKKIPVIIEPAAEKDFMGLLDIMNPKQQSKVLKNTKFTGETVTLYRGIKDWPKGKMVKEKRIVGPKSPTHFNVDHYDPPSRALFTSTSKEKAQSFRMGRWTYGGGRIIEKGEAPGKSSRLIEFEVPKSYVETFGINPYEGWYGRGKGVYSFEKGLPTAFIKKVHK